MRLLTILLLLGVTLTCEGLQIQSLYTQNNTPIPVNYSFNETLHPSISKYSSAPGCPTSIDGYPFLQYESFLDDEHSCQFNELKGPCPAPHPRKEVLCYLAGFQGPCPSSNEVLLPSNSSWPLGQCACSCSNYTTYKTKGFCLNPLNKRIIVLIPHLGRCYPLFEQGPCRPGEWLILDGTTPLCELRRCPPLPPGDLGFSFFHPGHHQCLQTGKAYQEDAQFIHSFHVEEDQHVPVIRQITTYMPSSSGGGYFDFSETLSTATFPRIGSQGKGCPKGYGFSQMLGLCLKAFHHFM